jgi:hypothetical protein
LHGFDAMGLQLVRVGTCVYASSGEFAEKPEDVIDYSLAEWCSIPTACLQVMLANESRSWKKMNRCHEAYATSTQTLELAHTSMRHDLTLTTYNELSVDQSTSSHLTAKSLSGYQLPGARGYAKKKIPKQPSSHRKTHRENHIIPLRS